jgi:raffinose/stachyose/melibiose transport system permease protein
MSDLQSKPKFRWHIVVFLAPAVFVYTAVMIYPLFNTLRLSLFTEVDQTRVYVGLQNFYTLFGEAVWSDQFWNALGNNFWFFVIHMLVQNPIGIALATILSHPKLRFSAFYRSAIFVPTILSFVIVGFAWKLILSPIWGIAPGMLDAVGLKSLYAPWLGQEAYALTTLSLVSVWQFVGIPMMLIYAALLSIPDEILEAAEVDGITGLSHSGRSNYHLFYPALVSFLS